jgi:ParB-like chromosome segregation protein Spo0J
MSPLKIRILPAAHLIPAPYNPRRAVAETSPAYRKLRKSLEDFGLVEPLIWNELTGHVVGGHLRLRILRDLGIAEVPVSVVRLTAAREKALNIVLNNGEAQGRYDTAKLADLLTELADLPEFAATGFGLSTLRSLRLEPIDAGSEGGGDPDRVEVTIVTDAATLAKFSGRLDALVRKFDLETHIKRGCARVGE